MHIRHFLYFFAFFRETNGQNMAFIGSMSLMFEERLLYFAIEFEKKSTVLFMMFIYIPYSNFLILLKLVSFFA